METVKLSVVSWGLYSGWREKYLYPCTVHFTKGEDKVAFEGKGAIVLTVIEVNIHRVDVLATGGGELYILFPVFGGVVARQKLISQHKTGQNDVEQRI